MVLDSTSGLITGTPSVARTLAPYTITASSQAGSTSFIFLLAVAALGASPWRWPLMFAFNLLLFCPMHYQQLLWGSSMWSLIPMPCLAARSNSGRVAAFGMSLSNQKSASARFS